jgi:3-oxoacyl-[acyl-carrier protein] reductase
MDLQIAGRTALVTGASAGIGTGIAECLAREGVRLALAGRSASALDAVGKRVTGLGGPAPVLISADIATTEGVAQVATAALDAFGGRVDFLINNAGGSRPLTGAETEEFWQEALDLNFQSARRLTARLEPGMREARSGRIINVTGAIFGRAINGAGAAKAALLAWSRAKAFELAPYGITVNCIAPGRINSVQILEKLHPTEASRADYIRQNIPAGRFGDPADMGNLAAFLVSPLAAYINGAHIPVDGGAVRIAP